MATLQWGLTCSDVVVDQSTNQISYRDAIERIRSPEFPFSFMRMLFVSSLWRRDSPNVEERIEARVVFENDDGEELGTTDISEVDLENHDRYRSNFGLTGFEVESPGILWFLIQKRLTEEDDWITVKRLPVEVEQIEAEEHIEQFEREGDEEE
jgi:hypothetical protein